MTVSLIIAYSMPSAKLTGQRTCNNLSSTSSGIRYANEQLYSFKLLKLEIRVSICYKKGWEMYLKQMNPSWISHQNDYYITFLYSNLWYQEEIHNVSLKSAMHGEHITNERLWLGTSHCKYLERLNAQVPRTTKRWHRMCDDIDGKLKLIIASELCVLYSILIISLTILVVLALWTHEFASTPKLLNWDTSKLETR